MLNKMRLKLSEGFTLVEILVVLVIVAILAAIAFVSYSPIVDKGYAAEAEAYLKEVSSASTLYEDMYGGKTPTIDELKRKGLLKPSPALEKDWSIEIGGEIFTATSTEEMDGGAGKTTQYNRETGEFSGYGFDYDGE
tara:strand:- start:243 stop:653 length:411 start_codon:yes stop_codon:yes gene_type:complete